MSDPEPTELEKIKQQNEELQNLLADYKTQLEELKSEDKDKIIKEMAKELKKSKSDLEKIQKEKEETDKAVILNGLVKAGFPKEAFEHLNVKDLQVQAEKLLDSEEKKGIVIPLHGGNQGKQERYTGTQKLDEKGKPVPWHDYMRKE